MDYHWFEHEPMDTEPIKLAVEAEGEFWLFLAVGTSGTTISPWFQNLLRLENL
jgi:hypothetical protein